MKARSLTVVAAALAAVLSASQIAADESARRLPARDIPVPDTVSPQEQTVIARPLSPIWNEHPKSAEEWKALVARTADQVIVTLPDLRQRLGVNSKTTVIGGVKAYIVTPDAVAEGNRDRLLVHVHGGGYVLGPGEAGTREAILMAGYGRMRVISVDYRMPPDALIRQRWMTRWRYGKRS
jgi:monoterpene epsilon-lactone hydrolase